ncbi:hypothetical protein JAAARDRAFT_45728 [Jaapia argillacea MUCL 33604]|uniref:Oxidoreductase AflY n=1 Tax=Jaapia argillacea MUCL 33604 TaxID=933084 RepID=A0A067Q282_9AGAM|nr:hypothetical protein JAAARDRAFT_45728 [Jaapia argillacea MUCL 33604]
MASSLPATVNHGILNFPGGTPESKATIERLLAEDREKHHCFFGKIGLHNHLSHHLLASYDLGAPTKLLEATYQAEATNQSPIHLADRAKGLVEQQPIKITADNWTEYLGQEKYYARYVEFYTAEVSARGAAEALETLVFSPAANRDGALMLLRFVGGAAHPFIQTGTPRISQYGVEFGSDAMVAQALAQTAVHKPFVPELFDVSSDTDALPNVNAQTPVGQPLLAILRQVYDSDILKPVMPYDNNALLSARIRDASMDGRPAEIRRLSALWGVHCQLQPHEFDKKVEELFWVATLLMAGTSKPGRKPRLDFFLMHILNATLFLPSLLKAIPNPESKAKLLNAYLPVILMYVEVRGRPRIDPELTMSYTSTPQPPEATAHLNPHPSGYGNPLDLDFINPWPAIISSVLHAPDAHTVKAIRALYYAAQHYGSTPAGDVPGAVDKQGKETHNGIGKLDGTVFVRAAGVVMDQLGWVTHGQPAGKWDASALGWDDAWKNGD